MNDARTSQTELAFDDVVSLVPGAVEALRRNLRCGDPRVEVAAADAVLRAVYLPQSAYSFTGHASNQTNDTLTLVSKDTNGSWTVEPPQTIAPGGAVDFGATYDGFNHTGTVVYEALGGLFTMTWQIPLFGNNTITSTTTISGTTASYQGGRGWHAEVWYFLKAV